MKRRAKQLLVCLCILSVLFGSTAYAAPIRTSVSFRITTPVDSAVVSVGEDLQIEVMVDGVSPTAYQWYFEGQPIESYGNQRIYNLLNATMEDAGLYRLMAYNGSKLLLAVDVNVRVVDTKSLPASGDNRISLTYAYAALFMGIGALSAIFIRKKIRSING